MKLLIRDKLYFFTQEIGSWFDGYLMSLEALRPITKTAAEAALTVEMQ